MRIGDGGAKSWAGKEMYLSLKRMWYDTIECMMREHTRHNANETFRMKKNFSVTDSMKMRLFNGLEVYIIISEKSFKF